MKNLRSRRAPAAVFAATTLVLTSFAALPAVAQSTITPTEIVDGGYGEDSTFTADALPTVQVDGKVETIEALGNIAYAGGAFANARPAGAAPGTNLTPRGNMLAFDVNTGELLPDFVADTDGRVTSVAISPDGATVYMAGTFTRVNGVRREGFAAVDAFTGQVTDLDLQIIGNNIVEVTATADTIFLGGNLGTIQGQARKGVAAFDATTGAILPLSTQVWGSEGVNALGVSPDGSRLMVGGMINRAKDASRQLTIEGFVLLDAVTGAIIDTPMYKQVPAGGTGSGGVTDVAVDDKGFYISGFGFGTGELESVAAADWDGQLRWMSDCHGDSTAVWSSGDQVHATGHPYACPTLGGMQEDNPRQYHALMTFTNEAKQTLIRTPRLDYYNYEGRPAPKIVQHFPRFERGGSPGNATWAIGGTSDYMVVGGDFPSVNGMAQQNLVRFPRRGITAHEQGPRWDELSIQAFSRAPGLIQVLVGGTYDRDDATLTYEIRGRGKVLDRRTIRSSEWAYQDYGFVDEVEPGSTQTYSVTVSDADGNVAYRKTEAVTAMGGDAFEPGASVASDYYAQVLADGAKYVWRPGQEGADSLLRGSGLRTTQGMMTTAWDMRGGTESYGYSPSTEKISAPHIYSLEAWIKTPKLNRFGKTKGGPIMGFGNQRIALSAHHDRMFYVNNDGGLTLGTHPQKQYTVSTQAKVADDQWHHVVATQDGAGVRSIYIDGQLAAEERQPTGAEVNEGYWRLGAEWVAGWPNVDAWRVRHSMTGTVDTPAVYHRALSAEEVNTHYLIGSGQMKLEPPAPPVTPTEVTDTFERNVANGWGVAEVGGDWSTWGGASVAGGKGLLVTQPRGGAGAQSSALPVDAATEVTIGVDAAPTAPLYLTLAQRKGEGYQYEASTSVRADGSVIVGLNVKTPEGTKYLGAKVVKDITLGSGQSMQLRLETVSNGEGGTDLKVYAWPTGSERPEAALVSGTDATEQLQDAGRVSFETYLGGAATAPVTVSVDNWRTATVGK